MTYVELLKKRLAALRNLEHTANELRSVYKVQVDDLRSLPDLINETKLKVQQAEKYMID